MTEEKKKKSPYFGIKALMNTKYIHTYSSLTNNQRASANWAPVSPPQAGTVTEQMLQWIWSNFFLVNNIINK